jgi:hypothetical protein
MEVLAKGCFGESHERRQWPRHSSRLSVTNVACQLPGTMALWLTLRKMTAKPELAGG